LRTRIRTETVFGGSRNDRSELASILDFIRPTHVRVMVKLDRLGSKNETSNWKKKEQASGFWSLPSIPGAMGRMVLTVLGMVAEMELGFIRDRQRAGIDAAKAKGVYKGRPATFDRARIVSLRREGMGATEIAKTVLLRRVFVSRF
jgi:DNA invertase Pin-like site-specific DNA recombinase